MDGGDPALGDQLADDPAGPLFVLEIDLGRRAVLQAVDFPQPGRLAQLFIVETDGGDMVALILEADGHHRVEIVDQPDRANSRGRQDRVADAVGTGGFVVEADIARDDRHVERLAGFGHALDAADELAHDMGFFGIAEIHAVGGCQRFRADGAEIAIGLGDRLLAAFIRVGLAIARGAVGSDGEALVGAMYPDYRGIAAGALGGVRTDL